MKILLCFIMVCGMMWGCRQESSGPCEYDIKEFTAEVTAIEPYTPDEYTSAQKADGKKLFHVAMQFDRSNLRKHTQYLEQLKEIEIDSAFLADKNIQVGYNYTGSVSEIIEGNCTPLFVSFHHNFDRD